MMRKRIPASPSTQRAPTSTFQVHSAPVACESDDSDEDDRRRHTRHDGGHASTSSSGSSSRPQLTPPPNNNPYATSSIAVHVRKRPLNQAELRRGEFDIIDADNTIGSVCVKEPKIKFDLTKYIENHTFFFDGVFDETVSNLEVYERVCRALIGHVFTGAKATCFAYGPTGAGKSFTMVGSSGGSGGMPEPGIYALAVQDIFAQIDAEAAGLDVYVSYFEIYGNKLFDLLQDRRPLVPRSDSMDSVTVVVGLHEQRCASPEALFLLVDSGNLQRRSGVTGANIDSSRSHAILQISLKSTGAPAAVEFGRISFIDLAGSERGADTLNSDRQTRMEGAAINSSLLALKECIRAQDQGKRHVPFRQSSLTRVLKDSFVGNSRTAMIVNIPPGNQSCEHTLNTLRYANRVKELNQGENNNGSGAHQSSSTAAAAASPSITDAYMPYRRHSTGVPKNRRSSSGGQKEGTNSLQVRLQQAKKHALVMEEILDREDALLREHQVSVSEVLDTARVEMELLRMRRGEDIGMEEYLVHLEGLMKTRRARADSLLNKISVLRTKLSDEESLSASIRG